MHKGGSQYDSPFFCVSHYLFDHLLCFEMKYIFLKIFFFFFNSILSLPQDCFLPYLLFGFAVHVVSDLRCKNNASANWATSSFKNPTIG